jgi:ethanolamine utilization protein EutA
MFARLRLQRLAESLSSRYVVVEREVLHRSPIVLTPYAGAGTIDIAALSRHVTGWFADAGLRPDQVDTGAVILTGAALERRNARHLADLFADESGKFVCASAGHALEATLAAHGAGSVARSRREGSTILHVDIGGGTTKLARIESGIVVATTAIAVGARLVAFDDHGAIDRIEPAARTFAVRAGVPLALGSILGAESRRRLAQPMIEALVAAIRGADVPIELRLLDPLLRSSAPKRITLSGGVSEYLAKRERADHHDLGRELAAALDAARPRLGAPLEVVPDGIRATVIGASQFSVQVSGSTIWLSGAALPLRNVPVRRLGTAPDGEGAVALAVSWTGEPEYALLRELAERIAAEAGARRPLVVAIDGDIAATLGAILRDELGLEGGLVTLDGLELGDLDYIDIGVPQPPSGVIPVIVKSLVFPESVSP